MNDKILKCTFLDVWLLKVKNKNYTSLNTSIEDNGKSVKQDEHNLANVSRNKLRDQNASWETDSNLRKSSNKVCFLEEVTV